MLAHVSAAKDPGAALAAYNPPHPTYIALREERLRAAGPPAIAAHGPRPQGSDPAGRHAGSPRSADPRPFQARPRTARIGPSMTSASRRRWRNSRKPRGCRRTASSTPAPSRPCRASRARFGERTHLQHGALALAAGRSRRAAHHGQRAGIPPAARRGRQGRAPQSRVIVGKEKTQTPIFSEDMKYLVVNPSWTRAALDPQEGVPAGARRRSRLRGAPGLPGDPQRATASRCSSRRASAMPWA